MPRGPTAISFAESSAAQSSLCIPCRQVVTFDELRDHSILPRCVPTSPRCWDGPVWRGFCFARNASSLSVIRSGFNALMATGRCRSSSCARPIQAARPNRWMSPVSPPTLLWISFGETAKLLSGSLRALVSEVFRLIRCATPTLQQEVASVVQTGSSSHPLLNP